MEELTPFSPSFFLLLWRMLDSSSIVDSSTSTSILIHVIRCQWMPSFGRDTSTFFATNCFIHGLLLTDRLGNHLHRYESLAFHSPYQVSLSSAHTRVLIPYDTSTSEWCGIDQNIPMEKMLSSDNNSIAMLHCSIANWLTCQTCVYHCPITIYWYFRNWGEQQLVMVLLTFNEYALLATLPLAQVWE